MKTLEEIRAYFAQDRFAAEMGIVIEEAGDDAARCSLLVQPSQCNALGRVQGGLLFTLADFTFAVAANIGPYNTVTLNSTIHYMKAPQGSRLSAEARPQSLGAHVCVYEVEVTDDTGTRAALVTTTGYRTGRK